MSSNFCWLGESIESLPMDKCRMRLLSDCYTEFGDDVSVLSRTDVHVAYFYVSEKFVRSFELAARICRNLDKKLIVISNLNYNKLNISTHSTVITKLVSHQQINELPMNLSQSIGVYEQCLSTVQLRLSKVDEYISKHLESDIIEQDVAKEVNLSTTYFSKFFRKNKPVSFQTYLSDFRIEKAKHLLTRNPSDKISSIAYQVGYSDVAYFNRVFKKHCTMTPTQYRKMSLNKAQSHQTC
ncbi:helix-turn-helix domain-containing protein [Vibrio breoganii]